MNMSAIATILIPWAAYHSDIVERAIKSAYAQTVKCDVIADWDEGRGTPAIIRNRALNIHTDFAIFLDADDLLEPTFVEECLKVYEQGKYVYTSWMDGTRYRKPKPCAWSGNSHHIVTTLYPTALFKALGGFDETLPGHEDADFYMRSYSRGICGVHLDKPLVLRPDDNGQRSKQFHAHEDYARIIVETAERNGGMAKIMSCCGNGTETVQADPGAGQPGDLLAETLWSGMRTEYSPYTERLYTGGNGNKLMVSPTDIEKLKDAQGRPLFRVALDLRQLAPARERVLKESGLT